MHFYTKWSLMSTSTPLRSSTSPPTSCCSGSDPLKQTLLKRPQFNPNLTLCHLVQLWSLENSLISLSKQARAVQATPSCCPGVLCTVFCEHSLRASVWLTRLEVKEESPPSLSTWQHLPPKKSLPNYSSLSTLAEEVSIRELAQRPFV